MCIDSETNPHRGGLFFIEPHESSSGVNEPHQTSPEETSTERQLTQALVHWQFNSQEWQQFLEFDKAQRWRHDARTLLVITILITSGLVVFILLGFLTSLGAALPAIGALVIFAGIIALAVIAHFLIQGQRYQRMKAQDTGGGDIYIMPEGIWANGVWFDWGESTAWQLTTVTPVLADTGIRLPPDVLSYIEFKCRGRAAGRHRLKVDKKWRVPVPRGKEDEARKVISFFGKPTTKRDEFGLPAD